MELAISGFICGSVWATTLHIARKTTELCMACVSCITHFSAILYIAIWHDYFTTPSGVLRWTRTCLHTCTLLNACKPIHPPAFLCIKAWWKTGVTFSSVSDSLSWRCNFDMQMYAGYRAATLSKAYCKNAASSLLRSLLSLKSRSLLQCVLLVCQGLYMNLR